IEVRTRDELAEVNLQHVLGAQGDCRAEVDRTPSQQHQSWHEPSHPRSDRYTVVSDRCCLPLRRHYNRDVSTYGASDPCLIQPAIRSIRRPSCATCSSGDSRAKRTCWSWPRW